MSQIGKCYLCHPIAKQVACLTMSKHLLINIITEFVMSLDNRSLNLSQGSTTSIKCLHSRQFFLNIYIPGTVLMSNAHCGWVGYALIENNYSFAVHI